MRFEIERHLGHLLNQRTSPEALTRGLAASTRAGGAPSPTPAPEFDPQDYVSFLLYVDAEIEHGLMVQYLYAAYSLGGPQVPDKYKEMIRGWQEVILGIAKEEMGHLISVQNVLCLIGAPLNFTRDDFPWDSPFYPFPFMLEPFTLESLAKYVFAEAPVDWSGDVADEVNKMVKAATPNPHSIAELFKQLIGLVQDPNFLPDEVFQAETWPFQAKWDEWGRGYQGGQRGDATHTNPKGTPDVLIVPVATRDDAVAALTQIAEQGEACPDANTENPSHFARFLKIFLEMKELWPTCEKERWFPARNVARNPYIPPSEGDDPANDLIPGEPRDAITNPEATLWGHLFNVRYRMLLNFLIHSYELAGGPSHTGPRTPRATIINATFGEMYNLRAIATIMVQTPLSAHPSADDKTAGPPFEMPYTLTRPMGENNRWRQHKNLLVASRTLIADLLAISPAARHRYLHALLEADQQLMGIIERILAANVNLAL